MKIIFIAGPLTTGGDGSREYIEKNIKMAEGYQIALANAGVGFFSAHTHTATHHNHIDRVAPEDFYYQLDMEILKRSADAVLAMPGWEKSWGAKREVEWAEAHGLKVFYPKSPDDIAEIIQWAK